MKGILLLHGFLTDPNDFAPVIPLLKQRYDIVSAPCFPGHGAGESYDNFTAQGTFAAVKEAYDRLRNECSETDVMGFSMGGALATFLAATESFRNLILLAPANKFLNFKLPFAALSFYVKNYFELLSTRKMEEEQKEKIIHRVDEKVEAVQEDTRNALNMGAKQLVPNWTPHNIKHFNQIIKICNKCLQGIVIDNPTLIVWGQLDQLVKKNSSEYIYKKCSSERKKLVVYDDISHLMLRSVHNEKIIATIDDFICENDVPETHETKTAPPAVTD